MTATLDGRSFPERIRKPGNNIIAGENQNAFDVRKTGGFPATDALKGGGTIDQWFKGITGQLAGKKNYKGFHTALNIGTA